WRALELVRDGHAPLLVGFGEKRFCSTDIDTAFCFSLKCRNLLDFLHRQIIRPEAGPNKQLGERKISGREGRGCPTGMSRNLATPELDGRVFQPRPPDSGRECVRSNAQPRAAESRAVPIVSRAVTLAGRCGLDSPVTREIRPACRRGGMAEWSMAVV